MVELTEKLGTSADMALLDLLVENKLKIASTWIEKVMATYSADGARFFKGEKDRFANPLGYSVEKGLERVLGSICKGEEIEELPSELFQFIKLRAVQDLDPSRSLSFLFELKDVVRDVCGVKELAGMPEEWAQLDRAIEKRGC